MHQADSALHTRLRLGPGSRGRINDKHVHRIKSGNTTDYSNNATAGIQPSAIIPGFQSLLDGTMTPQQFVDSIQKQYAKETK